VIPGKSGRRVLSIPVSFQVAGQPTSHTLAEIRYDPFVAQEKLDEGGGLVVH
jgi:hypothetical protein